MPKFIDEEHKQFYELKLQEIGKSDVYRKALIYILAMCETTREHFNDIFNIKDGEININSLQAPYQTGSSEKVTRMAFSLWNRCNYDSEEDIETVEVLANKYHIGLPNQINSIEKIVERSIESLERLKYICLEKMGNRKFYSDLTENQEKIIRELGVEIDELRNKR